MNKKKDRIIIYTDGSCSVSPGLGGFAFVALSWDKKEILKTFSKFLDITTSNQAELLATIYAVEWFNKTYKDSDKYLVVMTDSRYCSSGFNEKMEGWVSMDWNVPCKDNSHKTNLVLWKRLHEEIKDCRERIHFQWVQGHNGDEHNEMVHNLSYKVWQKVNKRK